MSNFLRAASHFLLNLARERQPIKRGKWMTRKINMVSSEKKKEL